MGTVEIELKTRLYVYISHYMSSWGDRMWDFGVGLFLIQLSPENLRLVAVYGFASGGCVLLFAALIGDWVDRTGRIKAARISLLLQNLLVIVCSVVVFFVFKYHEEIKLIWPDQRLADLCHAGIIIMAIISTLASIARKIAIERDWIVEICGRDKDMLATMTSKLRAIDLSTAILAPIATGQIISFTAVGYGAVFIGAWNLFSVVVEYYLIWKVYQEVPALRNKAHKAKRQDTEQTEENVTSGENTETGADVPLATEGEGQDDNKHPDDGDIDQDKQTDDPDVQNDDNNTEKEKKEEKGCLSKMFVSFITLYRGWKTYKKYDVCFAGLGLAMLFMTVLGFDNITVGFAYSQGVKEWVLGILMAAGSITGIMGTFAYPYIRRSVGLERTGLIGLGAQISALTLCVASVWAPGSPFDLFYASREPRQVVNLCTTVSPPSDISFNSSMSLGSNFTVDLLPSNNSSGYDTAGGQTNITVDLLPSNISSRCNTTGGHDAESGPSSFLSVSLLLAGITAARFGLWVADLTITQLFLQSVVESERGIVSGVQSSLNKLMDMMKFILVIAVPQEQLFGIHVVLSFSFICLGWVFYAKYSRSARGHLFHFEKVNKCLNTTNNNTNAAVKDRSADQEPVTEV